MLWEEYRQLMEYGFLRRGVQILNKKILSNSYHVTCAAHLHFLACESTG